MELLKCVLIAACVVYVSCASTRLEPEHRSLETGRSDESSGMKIVFRAYEQCEESGDTLQCLKGKALKFVDRALRLDAIPLMDGVVLVKTTSVDDARALNDADVEDPKTVDGLLVDRLSRFIDSHSLQFNVPKITENAKEMLGDEEGRGSKLKKMMGPLLMGLMMKGGMMALAFKAVALLAAKALMVAKIALVLAAVIGLSKLSHKGGGKVSYEIVKHPHVSHAHSHSSSVVHEPPSHGGWESGGGGGGGGGGGHGGWEFGGGGGGGQFRSFDTEFEPQVMAYNGQISRQQIDEAAKKQ